MLVAVASLRLSLWKPRPKSRSYTVALYILAVAFLLSITRIGDRHIDVALSGFAGANSSDLAHTALTVVAAWLFGLINLRGPASSRGFWRRVWTVYGACTVAALVMLYRCGDAYSVPVDRELELRDGCTTAYLALFYAYVAATCVLVFLGAAMEFRRSKPALRRALGALCGVGLLGVFYVGMGVYWLVHRSEWMRSHDGALLLIGPAVLLVGISVAGLSGVVNRYRLDSPPR